MIDDTYNAYFFAQKSLEMIDPKKAPEEFLSKINKAKEDNQMYVGATGIQVVG